MCEGSFLPSSFGPHQKHTEFESSLRSYPINPFALFAKGCGLFSRSRRESAFTHLSFRGAPRREPAFKYLSFRIRFSGEESAFCRGDPSFRVLCETAGTFSKPRRGGCPHPPGWGLFSRSRRESAFTALSFRIRFSGEESAFCRGAPR